ncbi:MAG: aryldialkylphosphatase [Naasia sp.]|uniref:phosphotriesterase family protein n=1 Tax=Naasia sp. TaxID=2546198 RepID=UPI0026294B9D|nr:hypothetical protein [Naasia sp.]MCU1570050.1 aryldialkylphosphatase [Naasia sp.]
MTGSTGGFVRTVLGDRASIGPGTVYMHEHLIIDSPLIADRFPHIHLSDVEAAVEEVVACREAGAVLMVDAMPVSSGRDAVRLAAISTRTGVDVITATGLHHDRYYGPAHWTNRVSVDELISAFVADLTEGVDEFDYTGPFVHRTPHRAGLVKVATSGEIPDDRDVRNMTAVAEAALITGAPILTHCEGGVGGLAQIEFLVGRGIAPSRIILSHVDKSGDLGYLRALAGTGVVLELDQGLRQAGKGLSSITVRATLDLITAGYGRQLVVGTDGARRDLWTSLGGSPGLAWLSAQLPKQLAEAGVSASDIRSIFRDNAVRALTWSPSAAIQPS